MATNIPLPGSPALHPTYEAASLPGTGAGDFAGSLLSATNQLTPNRTFSYAMPGGGSKTFYYGMKTTVSTAVYNAITGLGWAS